MTRTSGPGENQSREDLSRLASPQNDPLQALPYENRGRSQERADQGPLKDFNPLAYYCDKQSKNMGVRPHRLDPAPVPGRADPGTIIVGRLIVTVLLAGVSGIVWRVFGGGAGFAILAAGILALGFVFLRGGNKQND